MCHLSLLRLFKVQLISLDFGERCSSFVLMMQGYSLSAALPEEPGLGERFWYWRGASGRAYIHSIYSPGLCPPVAGAVCILVRKSGGSRQAYAAGRLDAGGALPSGLARFGAEDEVHIHLLARDEVAGEDILRDLRAALEPAVQVVPERRICDRPYQLELLAA